jgi:hypothetical protein
MPSRRGRRRSLTLIRPLLVALVLLTSLSGALAAAPAPVAAATPDLTLVTSARYVADPATATVAVGVDITATNHRQDTKSYRYYFDNAYLAVLPNSSGFELSASGASPSVAVARSTADYTLLHLVFGTRVYSGGSLRLHLAFELRDRGGSPTRDVRVGQALIQFPVWAFASDGTPGSSVSVVMPPGYTVSLSAGELDGPTTDASGAQVLTSGLLADPLSFFAFVTADRPGAYAASTITTEVAGRAAAIEVDAWPDDAAWGTRVADIFERGLPEIAQDVGLAYPRLDPLVVRESVSRTLGGYAGIFDPTAGRIDVDYAASPFVMLHEASHVWFNGSLLADRWADEGFATYYGALAAKVLGVEGSPDQLTPKLLESKIPLNDWGAVGEESTAVEDYAYAASALLATRIAERAGADDLRKVWAAASAREAAYQPLNGPTERTDVAPDWRGLLDLLEQETGRSFTDLWTEYVVRPADVPLLTQREVTRGDYSTLLAKAADWELPASIRAAMSAWRFDTAEGLITQADQVLDQRAAIDTAATAAGLTPPSTLRTAFESDAGMAAASSEADAELRVIGVIQDAASARPPADDALSTIGLIGSQPDARLAAARAAFAAGDLSSAASDALAAQDAWRGAHDAGLRRALSMGGVVLLLLSMLGALWLRLRSRRRAVAAGAAGAGSSHAMATHVGSPAAPDPQGSAGHATSVRGAAMLAGPPTHRPEAPAGPSTHRPEASTEPPDGSRPYATLGPEPPGPESARGGAGEGSEAT